ncbi:Integrase catalytic domain-containing protein [Durusdinium trenchii]|uniref:Integrase catalytic domain-containing protein n=1 Tax=Durusdinium trenchii TaxID=1381693 RepID=A0ABP0JHB4_9DINO
MWAFDDELSDDFELFTEDQVGAEDAEPAATTAADNVDGAGSRDFDESTRFDFDGDDEDAASALRAPSSSQSTRRRGRRGSGHGSSEKQKKWRSGHIPPPPQFSGDLEADPYCWRHYARSLRRWCLITSEYLPRSEQALRALDALVGEAAQEVEEIPDTRYFREDGIDVLLKDLEAAFGEREVYRRGGLIREFESLTRLQGESVDAFVRRYKLYERKLKDAKIPTYPSETRAVKLLDGLRLSEQATAHLLLAAGNKYDMDAILNAIKVQYPAGLTPTGLARHPATVVGPTRSRGRGSHGRGRGKSGGSFKWRTWQTEVQPDDEPAAEPAYGIYETVEDDPALTFEDPIDEQFEYQYDDYEYEEEPDEQVPEEVPADFEGDKEETAQALTATSKRLAAATQARGYYTSALKGKGKGVGKTKDKGDGKKGSTTSSSSTSKGKGQGGKSGKGAPKGASKGGKGKTSTQRHRLQSSLCLGSMSSSEWKDAWDPSAHPPSGCNPDDFMEAEDEWSMWQMEAHRANELLERQMPQSAGDVNPDDYEEFLDDMHFLRLEAEGAPYLAQRAPVVDPPVICLFREVTSHDDLSMLPKKTYHTDPVWQGSAGTQLTMNILVKMLMNVFNFMKTVAMSVIHYAAGNLAPSLRDRILHQMTPCTAVTMMSTMASSAVQASFQLTTYPKKVETCTHDQGLRAYGAGGQSARICDQCGFRAVVHKGQMVPVAPKASPRAKTPLQLPEHLGRASKAKSKAQSRASAKHGSSEQLPSGWGPSSPSWQDSSSAASQTLNSQILKQVEEQVQKRLELLVPKAVAAQRQTLEMDNASNQSWDQIGGGHWWSPAAWEADHSPQEDEDYAETEPAEPNFEQMSLDGSSL